MAGTNDPTLIIRSVQCCSGNGGCDDCLYKSIWQHSGIGNCTSYLASDVLKLLEQQKEERKRMLSWLSKFCRHIDNGDKWLTDEENLEFFREKMKQQFGWSDT